MIGSRHDMTNEQWQRMERVMPKGLPGPPRKDDRKVTARIFFVLRTGMPWRDLPERYGSYTTCYNRFNRWSKSGRWQKILDDLQQLEEAEEEAADEKDDGDPGPRSRMIDSSSIRAHRHAAQGRRVAGDRGSRGGWTTKIHAMVDGKAGPAMLDYGSFNRRVTGPTRPGGDGHPRLPLPAAAGKGSPRQDSTAADER